MRKEGCSLPPAIDVQELVKRYGRVTAVDGISFSVASQEIFGFLGPNGAGKTTTIQILATLVRPTSGRAQVAGYDVARSPGEVRQRIGLVFQDSTLDDRLTGEENLLFHGLLYGLSPREVRVRASRLLRLVDLHDRACHLVRTYSGGMRRRLELVRGLIHRPRVLFLDEPTVGLDPQTRAHMWEHIRALAAQEDVTVFLTTHYLEEAEHCHRVAIMDHGRIVALGTPAELKRQVGSEILVVDVQDPGALPRIRALLAEQAVQEEGTRLRIVTPDAARLLPALASAAGTALVRAEIHRPTLDDVFLQLTGRQIREETASARDRMRRWHGRRGQ